MSRVRLSASRPALDQRRRRHGATQRRQATGAALGSALAREPSGLPGTSSSRRSGLERRPRPPHMHSRCTSHGRARRSRSPAPPSGCRRLRAPTCSRCGQANSTSIASNRPPAKDRRARARRCGWCSPLPDRCARALARRAAVGARGRPAGHDEADRLRELRLEATDLRHEAMLLLGEHAAAVPELQAFVARTPSGSVRARS